MAELECTVLGSREEQRIAPGQFVLDDNWEIVSRIGGGGQATVYEIRMGGLMERHCALKVIDIPKDESEAESIREEFTTESAYQQELERQIARVQREVRTMDAIHGEPAAVHLEDCRLYRFEDDGSYRVLIRMELLTPLTKKYGPDNPLSREDTIRLGLEIGELLEVCEQEKILHRDIKPGNLFVTDRGHFKLGDFGLARASGSLSSSMSHGVGTDLYMAPEVARGFGDDDIYDHRADLYSLALVLYQYLNGGQMPFENTETNRKKACLRRLKGMDAIPEIASLPQPLNAFLQKALADDPEDRYPDAVSFLAALREAAAGRAAAPAAVPQLEPEAIPEPKPEPIPEPEPDPIPEPEPEPISEPEPEPIPEPEPESLPEPEPEPIPQPAPKPVRTYEPGDIVAFGRYPQDPTGTEHAIEWLVLEVQDECALLVSRFGLDAKPYHTAREGVTWERSSIREWLNDSFLKRAFLEFEQAAIQTTDISNQRSECFRAWDTDGGSDTKDKVFLLSCAEAKRYFEVSWQGDANVKAMVIPTRYAHKQGAYEDHENLLDGLATGWWWLRSPGESQNRAAYVMMGGLLFDTNVDYAAAMVRPAIWVDLRSGLV